MFSNLYLARLHNSYILWCFIFLIVLTLVLKSGHFLPMFSEKSESNAVCVANLSIIMCVYKMDYKLFQLSAQHAIYRE